MSGQMSRRVATAPIRRERDRELAVIQKQAQLAAARAAAVGQLGQAAMFGTLALSMMKREASFLVPEDAAKFDLVATTAVLGMAQQINRLANQ
ncbi:MAG TPA: hypothetical protein VK816_04650 [Jatrophihabitantaceae bacterium]|jgi:hypothetical protein|nr:hypothetical protein [Jatrophihabitantaceae bacterium]